MLSCRPVVCFRALVRIISWSDVLSCCSSHLTMIRTLCDVRVHLSHKRTFPVYTLVAVVERMNFQPRRASSVKVPFPVFATGVPVGPVFLLGLLALAIDAACAFRAEEIPSLISCLDGGAKVMAGVSDVESLLEAFLSKKINAVVRMTSQVLKALRGYGMIHEDGDNDAISGNDDKLEIIRYETGFPL
ncbi:hypothetical protein Tco_0025735 [Tanacetum coccineum]